MGHRFAEIVFTPTVKAMQEQSGSRDSYARMEGGDPRNDRLGPSEAGFIGDRDSFHAVVGEGILAERGMVGFAKVYSPAEIEAIRAYIISRARKDFSAR